MKSFETRKPVVLSHDGINLFGMIHLPNGVEKAPVVLIAHGHAGTKVGRQRIYVTLAESLSRMGIASLRVDFRGCGDSEGCYSKVTVAELVSDANASLEFVRSHQNIDSDRIGLLGTSLGGPIVSTLAHQSKVAKSLVMWAPLACGKLWQEDLLKHHGGELPELPQPVCPEFQEQFLAIRAHQLVQELSDIPYFHAYGGRDQVILPGHRDHYKAARANEKAPSKFLFLPNSCHHFSHRDERNHLIEQTADWFRSTL